MKGEINHWGVSNFSKDQIEFLLSHNHRPVLNQVEYHPYFQQPDLRNYCQSHGIILQSYRPLAEGKCLDDPILLEIANKYNVSSAQIIYAWLSKQGIAIVSKTSLNQHQQDYIDAAKVNLSDNDMDMIYKLNKGPNGRTCTKGGWLVSFTDLIKNTWLK